MRAARLLQPARSIAVCALLIGLRAPLQAAAPQITVELPQTAPASALTGRIFLVVTRQTEGEPRLLHPGVDTRTWLFGKDVHDLRAGQSIAFGADTPGFPAGKLAELPPGSYRMQAVLNVYTKFDRADGQVLWLHMDQWEGQKWQLSPGNRVSDVAAVWWSATSGRAGQPGAEHEPGAVHLSLARVIPPITVPPDTVWVKHLRIQSPLLSRFWGHPIYLGATVLLPKGYAENSVRRYPAIYLQGHFNVGAPFGFTTVPDPKGYRSWARMREEWRARHLNVAEPPQTNPSNGSLPNVESGYEFQQSWIGEEFPRVIAVTFQHPTPYGDDSYGIDSANAGPYGQALMTELIPYVETHFRIIRAGNARTLAGASTGGWASLALQIHHPEFFGGAWAFSPDPVDLRRYYGGVDLYAQDDAFHTDNGHYLYPVRNGGPGNEKYSRLSKVLGSEDGEFAWSNLVPVGPDGLPQPLWDLDTGRIDHAVAESIRAHGYDLRDYLERNWPAVGPKLVGKLHVYCGDDDTFYLNLAVYLLQEFLENTHDPYYAGSFTFGRPLKRHGWMPMTNAELVRVMAAAMPRPAP